MLRLKPVLCVVTLLMPCAVVAEQDWRLVKDEEGIQVYLKDVPGSSYQAYRGVAQIHANLDRLLALQDDPVQACQWIYECRQQKMLKQDQDRAWTYTQVNTPWPVQARDTVLQIDTRRLGQGEVVREISAAPSFLPKNSEYVRVPQANGYWKFTAKGAQLVEVVYELHAEPGGHVPAWLANRFVVESPFQSLQQLRRLAQSAP